MNFSIKKQRVADSKVAIITYKLLSIIKERLIAVNPEITAHKMYIPPLS